MMYPTVGGLANIEQPNEDMTPMYMTMFSIWYGGVGGQ